MTRPDSRILPPLFRLGSEVSKEDVFALLALRGRPDTGACSGSCPALPSSVPSPYMCKTQINESQKTLHSSSYSFLLTAEGRASLGKRHQTGCMVKVAAHRNGRLATKSPGLSTGVRLGVHSSNHFTMRVGRAGLLLSCPRSRGCLCSCSRLCSSLHSQDAFDMLSYLESSSNPSPASSHTLL